MKKIYLCALALSVGSLSFGQHIKPSVDNPFDSQKHLNFKKQKEGKPNTITNNDKGALLYSNTCSTAGDWTFTNASIPALDWVIESDVNIPSASGLAPFTSTTASNGFLHISSDLVPGNTDNNGTPVEVTARINTSFSTVGYANIVLSFQQNYRWWQDAREVRVSGDNGVTWTTFEVTNIAGSPTPQQTTNGELITFDISAVAGNKTDVLIEFYYFDNDFWGWYWEVDDVEVREKDNNELVLTDPYYGTAAYPYSRIPASQIQPIDFVGKIMNDGIADQPNTVLSVDINSGAYTAASTAQTVVVGATDSIFTVWTPPATVGVPYIATMTVASDSTDATPANNTFTFPAFEVSQYVYAYDDYAAAASQGAGGGVNGTEAAYEAGNSFDIWTTTNLTALDVVVGAGTAVGSNFKGVLYEVTATAPYYSFMAETQFYQTDATSIGNVTQLLFSAPITLNPNTTYFAGISVLSEFYYGTSGFSPGPGGTASTTSSIYYGTMDAPIASMNFYTTNTPMVRMNFDPSLVGIDEVKDQVKFNVFPNPSNGVFNINLSSNDNVNLTVKNVVGQTVISETVTVSGNTNHKISLTDYSKGIYFLTVGNETVKLIVE